MGASPAADRRGNLTGRFRRYSGRTPNRDLVDDLIQQVYIRLCANDYQVLRRMAGESEASFLAFVKTVACNLSIDYLRSNWRTFDAVEDTEPARDDRNIEQFILFDSVDRHLAECAKNDPTRSREIFWLYYCSGLTSKAIAEIRDLELTQKGVESLLLRLSRCIRRALAEGIGTPKALSGKEGSLGAL